MKFIHFRKSAKCFYTHLHHVTKRKYSNLLINCIAQQHKTENNNNNNNTTQIIDTETNNTVITTNNQITQPRQYKCPHCTSSFRQSGHLSTHILIKHTPQKMFKCLHPGCNKTFPVKWALRTHMNIHNNTKRFICQFCQESFHQKINMITHILNRHNNGKNNYTCDHCNKTFVTKYQLASHLRSKHYTIDEIHSIIDFIQKKHMFPNLKSNLGKLLIYILKQDRTNNIKKIKEYFNQSIMLNTNDEILFLNQLKKITEIP